MSKWAYKWQVVVSVLFGTALVIMDATVVNVALPKLSEVFANGNFSDIQLVISVYTLALGIVTPLSGFLADRYGIKKIFVFGLAAFTISSALCAIAPNLELLVFFRVLQGLGGGSVIPLGTALLFGAFPREERGLAFGVFGIAVVVAPALGPVLSGAIVQYLDWRLIFLINLPIGLAGVFVASRFLKESKGQGEQRWDIPGIITSVIAFGTLLYGFSSVERDGWGSATVLTCISIGVVFLIIFIGLELRRHDGLVDFKLFKNPIFIVGNVIGWISTIAFFGAEFLLPLYLQNLRGLTALETGLMLLPLAVAAGISTPLAGRFSDKLGARPLVVVGFALLMFNTWQLSTLQADTSLIFIGFLLAIRGIALGLVIQVTQQVALNEIAPRALPRASSLVNASRQIFQSLGVALLATVLTQIAGARPNFRSASPAQIAAYNASFLQGLETAYLVTFFVGAGAVLLGFFLPGWPAKSKPQAQPSEIPAEASNGVPVEAGEERLAS